MTAAWYVQPLTHDLDTSQRVAFAVQEAGLELHTNEYRSFGTMDWSFLPSDRPVVFLGSINVLKDFQAWAAHAHNRMHRSGGVDPLQDRPAPYPFAWCDWKKLSCSHYYAHLGPFLLAQNYAFLPLRELERCRERIWAMYGCQGKLFIRPDTNDKIFCGDVVDQKNWVSWWNGANWDSPPPELPVVVATPTLKIRFEYRVVVADGRAVAIGQYQEDGGHCIARCERLDVCAYAEQVAATWTPHPIFCLDIAETEDGLAVVEIGAVNVAGFYGCALRPIVEAASRIATRDWEEAYGTGVL